MRMATNQTELGAKKANRMSRSGAKPKPIPQAPQVLTFVPAVPTYLHPNATGGYRFRKGTI